MKKLVCALLALIAIFTLFACGPQDDPQTQSKAAFTLPYNGQTIKIDAKADGLVAAYGTPKQYQELPTCGKGDLDKLYDFGSVRIRTYQISGVDYVSVIELMDDLVTTAEGVAIGNAQDAVLTAYGEADQKTDTAWIYHATGMDLEFHFHSDHTIKSIVYRGEN